MPFRRRHDKSAHFTASVEKRGTCSKLASRRGEKKVKIPFLLFLHPLLILLKACGIFLSFLFFFLKTVRRFHFKQRLFEISQNPTGEIVLQPRSLRRPDQKSPMGHFYASAVKKGLTQFNCC